MRFTIRNPLDEGQYADPEARVYGGKYYIYVTHSLPYREQQNHTCFVSEDLTRWEKIENQQPCEVGRAGSSVSIYTDVEAEAQRGLMTCSRPHSKLAIELGPELGLGARLSPLTAVSSRGPQPLSRVSATPEPGPPAPWQ